MAGIPAHPDLVDPSWLTERLAQAGVLRQGRITALRWEPIGTGQVGDSVRFHLAYDTDGQGPATIAGKFPAADPTSRATAAAFGLYAKEVGFYRELRAALDVRVPQPLVAELDDNRVDFVLLFEDLAPARGGNQLAGCGIADARHAIRQAAALHAPSMRDPAVTGTEWLQPRGEATTQVRALYPGAQAIFRTRYAESLEADYMDICERLAAMGDRWFGRDAGRNCLVHGDFRLDNMLFDVNAGAEPLAVLDWQTVQLGSGLTDIGYFMGCGIGPELRRAHERELLELYCAEMTARGVPLTIEAIWDDYRRGALHGVSTAVFSAAYVERTPRGDANFLSMARGACDLALEHDSLGAL